jgi:chorismate mutase
MEKPEQKLATLRAKIDAVDTDIAALLGARMEIVREVAKLKSEHWPNNCHIRPGREGQMHRAIAARFKGSAFPPVAALAVWRQLIGASTQLESPIHVTTLAAHPEHEWMAREYFGVQATASTAANLDDALAQMKEGSSNILVLPDPAQSDWWKDAEKIRKAGLFVFAALPVVKNGAGAVALAQLKPEDSGEDVSYHVVDGKLHTHDGFVPETRGIFLGAHPKPLVLGD